MSLQIFILFVLGVLYTVQILFGYFGLRKMWTMEDGFRFARPNGKAWRYGFSFHYVSGARVGVSIVGD